MGIGPNIFTVSHGGVENAAFAVLAGPGLWEVGPVVFPALHSVGDLSIDDVHVVREVDE